MPQRLSPCRQVQAGDRDHAEVITPEIALIGQILLLLALLLLPGVLRAQGRGAMQVAARVLPVEPSRTALGLAVRSLDDLRPAPRYSSLARVRVEPGNASVAEPARRVRIDFLRN